MILPRILIFDDVTGWDLDARRAMCKELALADGTDSQQATGKDKSGYIAEAVFHPAQTRSDNYVQNDVDAALRVLAQGWDNSGNWRWAMVLLDLQFAYGQVNDSPITIDNNWPRHRDDQFGVKLLEAMAKRWPDSERNERTEVPVVALSSRPRADLESKLNKLGNLGYLERERDSRPVPPQELRRQFADHLFSFGLVEDIPMTKVELKGDLRLCQRTGKMIGKSLGFLNVLREARKAASVSGPCLILGATGSGKEGLARYIHDMSDRSSQPFIDVHCGAIPEGLIESELFGYAPNSGIANAEKAGKPGKFELANRGTILLDEVGTMNGLVQVKLLRVLQEGVVARLSATKNTPIDVKVIAATNKNLDIEVRENRFQPDLLNRLEGFVITIPPLYDRKEDVKRLFDFFLEAETKKIDGAIWPKEVDSEVYQELLNRKWEKGNVRSLEALVKRLASDRRFSLHISATDIHREVKEEGEGEDPKDISIILDKNGSTSIGAESVDESMGFYEEIELERLFYIIKNIKVPQALSKIKGKLTALNSAYGSLVKRFLEIALEETKDDDNEIVPTTAVKKLLDRSDMTSVQAAGYLWGIRDLIGSEYGDYPNVNKAMEWAEQRVKKQRGNKPKKSGDEV